MNFVLLILILSLILILGLYKTKIKGVIGEKTTSSILYFLDKSKYKVINNIVLKTGEITTQIDHLVISDFGIFVIETKNYKGWILGNENSEYWTQVIYKRKEKLYNPIRQNLSHIKTLKNCLSEYPNLEYKSIIVFSSSAEIKVNTRTDVVNLSRLLATIKRYTSTNLTEIEKENIFEKINALNLIDTYDKHEHIKSIKQRIQKRKNSIRESRCPQCGNNLIMRNGKFGNFLGCKSHPKCKFIQNI
ncbi:NERD domain-containing protein [Flavobacterium sp.]|uniref:NERD domain-containing protein n=1 Tax=Flavobacterium sp. TaxID=239 RepID=UPI0025C11A30|nr:NERD domain-containing protein [Flavobacterium sp.]